MTDLTHAGAQLRQISDIAVANGWDHRVVAEILPVIIEAVFLSCKNLRMELQRQGDSRYSHDEIEMACGSEVALEIRRKVLERRARVVAQSR